MQVPDAEGAEAHQEFALFDVGTQRLGVPSHSVLQAVVPPSLTLLSHASPVLAGVFVHRGQVVPLLDLQRWMAPEPAATVVPVNAQRQVLILQVQGKILAVLIDALQGLLRVPAADVRRIHHDTEALGFFHSVAVAQDQSLITLLDPARLALQAQVWAEAPAPDASPAPTLALTPASAPASPQTAHVATPTETFAVVRVGAHHLALPATAVGEVVGGLVLKSMAGLGGGFMGMAQWRGKDVPVLDICRVLGLPQPAPGHMPWLLVLHWQSQVLAFPVHEVSAVRTFDASTLQAAEGIPPTMQAFCHSSCPLPDGTRVYLLQAQALLEASPLSRALAPAAQALQSAQSPLQLGYQHLGGSGALVVFKSRQLWAAPMELMREIVKPPVPMPHNTDPANALLGSLEWRGQALALWDLRMTLDSQGSQQSADARVIVLQSGAQTVALLVEAVVALVPGHAGTRSRFSTNGRPVEMVTVGSGGQQVSYQLMDLSQLACFAPA